MSVRSGEEFLEGLRDDREVWLEGERVQDVTTHPKLARMAKTLAGVYDLQCIAPTPATSWPSSPRPPAIPYRFPT